MSFLEWAGAGVGGVLLLYLIGRIVSAAIYKSKLDYERSLKNEPR